MGSYIRIPYSKCVQGVVVQFSSSLLLVVDLNPMNQKNTTWPTWPFLWGPLFLASCPPKHWRFCRFETLTFNNSTASGSIFMQSFSGGHPEPHGPKKHNLPKNIAFGVHYSLRRGLKHQRYCRYETLTLNNCTPTGPILKQSFSGGSPGPNWP